MGYFLTSQPENAVPGKTWVPPKTHTPGSRLEKRGRRFYSPDLGRWLSCDPIGQRGGINLSGFVQNDPILLIDYLGTMGCKAPCKCCCVDDLKVTEAPPPGGKIGPQTWQGIVFQNSYYHDFTATASTSAKNSSERKPCTVYWDEFVAAPPLSDTPDAGKNSFLAVVPICPGSSWSEQDQPGFYSTGVIADGQRVMLIRITVKSAPGCPCALQEKKARITQKLKVVGGIPDKSFELLDIKIN